MEGCQGASGTGEWGERERGEREREGTGECVCSTICGQAVSSKDVRVFICCLSVRTRVLVTMSAFACMSMRMSTHS